MAIDYSIYLAAPLDTEQLLCRVDDALGLDHTRIVEHAPHNPTLVGRPGPGFYLNASKDDDARSAEIKEEWLGFAPRVHVTFRMEKEGDCQAAFLRVLRVTSALLRDVPGDLALINNGENVLIIRTHGRVVAVDDPLVLDAEALSQLLVPYELGSVPKA